MGADEPSVTFLQPTCGLSPRLHGRVLPLGPTLGLCSFTLRLSSKPSRVYSTLTGTSPKSRRIRMSTHRRNIDRRTEGGRDLEKCPPDRHFPETLFSQPAASRTHPFLAFPPALSLLGAAPQWMPCPQFLVSGSPGGGDPIWDRALLQLSIVGITMHSFAHFKPPYKWYHTNLRFALVTYLLILQLSGTWKSNLAQNIVCSQMSNNEAASNSPNSVFNPSRCISH